jgi:hypothetical protein
MAMSDGEVSPGSALLETVARDRGVRVDRLTADLVVCDDGRRRVAFHGMTGSTSGKTAHVLCGNDAWLRSHLSRQGLPTVDTALTNDAEHGWQAAGALGLPVVLRLAGTDRARVVADESSFHAGWREVAEQAADLPPLVILERRPEGELVEVAVVDGRVVASSRPTGVGPLALRAIAALPGVAYGSVRLVGSPDAVVDTVDLSLCAWTTPGNPAGPDIAAAILAVELDPTP